MAKFSKKYYYNNWKIAFSTEYTLCDFITENELEEAKIIDIIQEDKNEDGDYVYLIIFKHKLNNG